MKSDDFTTGAVIRYPYLWHHQSDAGETEGRKERPVVVAVRLKKPGFPDTIILFPITTKMPEQGRFSAEIPHREKLNAGLDETIRLWIIVDDVNVDIVTKSVYLKNQTPSGRLSKRFFLPLVLEFIRRKEEVRSVNRTL